jgi:hypothetical protein
VHRVSFLLAGGRPAATLIGMKRRPPVIAAAVPAAALLAAAVLAAALGGCGLLDADSGTPAAAGAAGVQPTPSGSGVSGLGAAGRRADGLPDPCAVLSRSEVTGLTGRRITEVDGDDARPDDTSRYCQWQLDGGELALFLSRTTVDGFEAGVAQARPVDGVEGYDAFSLAGHLYVRDDDVQVDVYSHGCTDDENLAQEITVMKAVLPKLERPEGD